MHKQPFGYTNETPEQQIAWERWQQEVATHTPSAELFAGLEPGTPAYDQALYQQEVQDAADWALYGAWQATNPPPQK
jgi:hypothetical protein